MFIKEKFMITLSQVSFTNEFNDKIEVGDTVIVITTSYKTTYVKKGIYLGMHGGQVVVEVPSRRIVWEDNTWTKYHYVDSTRRSYLQDNRIYPTTTPLSNFAGKYL